MRHDPSGVAVSDAHDRLKRRLDRLVADARREGLVLGADTDVFARVTLLKAQTTIERLNRENEGLSAQLAETRRERDTARRDLDAVRRVLAEGLGADARESDLDALALAARACETIDCLRAQVTSITTERDDDRADAAQMLAGWRALTAENETIRHGETTPSLDAIRAHAAISGRWVCTWREQNEVCCEALHLSSVGESALILGEGTYSVKEFARRFGDARWWRVAADGSLAVGVESSS